MAILSSAKPILSEEEISPTADLESAASAVDSICEGPRWHRPAEAIGFDGEKAAPEPKTIARVTSFIVAK
jgi:hypothetical protein